MDFGAKKYVFKLLICGMTNEYVRMLGISSNCAKRIFEMVHQSLKKTPRVKTSKSLKK